MYKIGIIGAGNMAYAIIKGLRGAGLLDIRVSDIDSNKTGRLKNEFNVEVASDNILLASNCPVIILAVKPQVMDSVLDELSLVDLKGRLIISIAAGVRLSRIRERLDTGMVVRVMPNTPALVLEGMSVIAFSKEVSESDRETVISIFSCIGKTAVMDESYMDAVTALSGSGPAFVAYFIDALINAAKNVGLDAAASRTLAVQTLRGTARLLEEKDPDILIKEVASPGGTTEAGLKILRESNFNSIIHDTIKAAAERSIELGREKK